MLRQSLIIAFTLLIPSILLAQKTVEWKKGSYKINNERRNLSKDPKFIQKSLKRNLSDPSLEYFGGIRSPSLDGVELHASDVFWNSSKAQVFSAYNFRGAPKKGAVQLIKLEHDEIFVNSEIIFDDSDINTIYMVGDTLYFAGTDSRGAFASSILVRREEFVGLQPKVYLPGYVATDIFQVRDRIFVTTGDNACLRPL